jgi:hypothetical protein
LYKIHIKDNIVFVSKTKKIPIVYKLNTNLLPINIKQLKEDIITLSLLNNMQ